MTSGDWHNRKTRDSIKRNPEEPFADWRRRYKKELARILRLENREHYLIMGRKTDAKRKHIKEARRKTKRLANLDAFRERERAAAKRHSAARQAYNKKWMKVNGHRYRAANVARVSKYVIAKINAVPKWADLQSIKSIYEEAAMVTKVTGIRQHVDHIIPLRGKTVCGLHVHTNLRIVPYYENCSKGNKLIEGLAA